MRIGLIALLHESNTFSHQPTTLESFRQNLLLTGEPIRHALADAHHEVGGFFAGLDEAGAEAVPLFAARALPSGTIASADFDTLVSMMLEAVRAAGKLDGILVAPHGATVSEEFPDADGHWLSVLRREVGEALPIIGTLDAHANLSPPMVDSCNALVAYRTNPHLDQRARGIEAARLMVQTVRGEISPVMAAAYPPMAISIDRQCTDEPHLQPLYTFADEQLKVDGILSNSVLLGFPYADVTEMGSAVIVVTNGDKSLAQLSANRLAESMWSIRHELAGEFTSVDEALTQCPDIASRICLLDMGDNVGGGSAADGTELLAAIHERRLGPAFGCVYDPESVQVCQRAGVGQRVRLQVGGKTDNLHGAPIEVEVTIKSLCDGKFNEPQPRHGGITEFDQGRTAICETDAGLTLMLTSLRMVPFSLQQLYSCGVNPKQFRLLVAKGVNAPIAAYRDVCEQFIRVNTLGSTCADMSRLNYEHRRRPLFPLEQDAVYPKE
ncbi:MAG: M81 family metallopeptidase [Planctomycetaceae bacterium]|nr:M81 family metallopeptidase [Planctomycetaceae bacterium]MCA9043849.1 M81 family metallopeptidase [Planctomycetaceae bacterium]